MNFLGQEAISRSTQTTGRTLLVLAFTLIVYKLGWIEAEEASIIGLRFKDDTFGLIVSLVMGFVFIAHLVQWSGDFLSYESWNVDGRKISPAFRASPTETRLTMLIRSMSARLAEDEDPRRAGKEQIERLDQLTEELRSFRRQLSHFGWFSFFYVYIWHLILPLSIAAIAVFGTWRA